ncbi:MAG: hypothetical protein JWN72_2238 [Thermoleophilia bacterium]|nr:hypothetical protein [Thermoleophilia bacterium]
MPFRLIALALLLTSSLLLAACGSTESKGGSGSSSSDTKGAKGAKAGATETTATSRDDRAQAQTVTSGAGFASCIEALGFATMPPAHGVAAQWGERTSGAVLAVSSDASQAATATVAAQFSRGDRPATLLGSGMVVSGNAPARVLKGVRRCAPLR